MKKYEVVKVDSNNVKWFNEKINNRLKDGWKLYGFPLAPYSPQSGVILLQAMTFEEVHTFEKGVEEK